MARILVVDDQRNMRATLAMMLRAQDHDVDEAPDGDKGIEMAVAYGYDLVITDLRMGARDGLEVLRRIKEAHVLTEVIVMTAFGSIESAVEAMRLGAYDYIQKPFSEDELRVKVQRALERRSLGAQVALLTAEFRDRYRFENIIGRSPAIREVLTRVAKFAPTDATVLITGESGTGKELVAKAIHANSKRADKPFVPINCAAVTETLLESELFGHVRGAFTGAVGNRRGLVEEADGGTFFFDEMAETTPAFQAKLLRVLQEGEVRRVGDNRSLKVNIRVVAATNQDLHKAIAEKRFRQDLYYRLNVARFVLPPLRDRREDIPLLVEHFLAKYCRKMGVRVRLGDAVMEYLMGYEYPGNIRELENMIEQAVALASQSGVIQLEDVAPQDLPAAPRDRPGDRTLASSVDAAERAAIEEALRDVEGNRERAAEALGLSPTTLWRKMKRLDIRWST
jgi:two-component system response regulator HydG